MTVVPAGAAAAVTLPTRGLRVRRRCESPAGTRCAEWAWTGSAWAEALGAAADVRVFKHAPGAFVVGLTLSTRGADAAGCVAVVVKAQRVEGVWGRVRDALGRTRLDRQWARAALVRARCRAAVVGDIAVCSARDEGGARWTMLISERVEGDTLLRAMAAPPAGRARRALARAAGALAAELARAGLMNRDLKPSNVIVRGGALVLIDLAGVARASPGGARVLAPMLASLVIEPSGCGVAIRRTDRSRAVRACVEAMGRELAADRRLARRGLWRAVDARVRAHGDPTPKHDPLKEPA